MKTISKTKIEWCDYVYNPVWGCKNNCIYCYARKIAKRFASKIGIFPDRIKKMKKFEPVWIYENYSKNFPKKSSNIFVNSMSDIYYWKPEWMKNILYKIRHCPQHNFIFLTKKPEIYRKYDFPINCWLGTTITKNSDIEKDYNYIYESYNIFYSLEPIQEKIDLNLFPIVKWIILGMESGNRKEKVIPDLRWILEIFNFCYDKNIPIFMKDNLKDICDAGLIQEFPKELNHGKN